MASGRFLTVVAVALATAAGTAGAQSLGITQDDAQRCQNADERNTTDAVIAACSSLISSGRLTFRNLGVAYESRGIAYAEKKEFVRAIADFDRAVAALPGEASFDYSRGTAYLDVPDYDKAIADLDHALQIKPGHAESLANRCIARVMAGSELDVALADCNEALRIQPGDPITIQNRGLVYARQGKFTEAFNHFDAVCKAYPRAARALYGRGVAHVKLGRKALGDADIAAATALDRTLPELFERMGLKP